MLYILGMGVREDRGGVTGRIVYGRGGGLPEAAIPNV